jgi:hypothetical protein
MCPIDWVVASSTSSTTTSTTTNKDNRLVVAQVHKHFQFPVFPLYLTDCCCYCDAVVDANRAIGAARIAQQHSVWLDQCATLLVRVVDLLLFICCCCCLHTDSFVRSAIDDDDIDSIDYGKHIADSVSDTRRVRFRRSDQVRHSDTLLCSSRLNQQHQFSPVGVEGCSTSV